MIHRPPYKCHSERFLSLFLCEESINKKVKHRRTPCDKIEAP